jgi:uncharacterized protein
MAAADIDVMLSVTVAYSAAPRQLDVVELTLAPGATVAWAIEQSGLQARHANINLAVQKIGVWGHLCALDHVLRDFDRVEIYRPLLVDPKEARRLRYKRDRVTSTATSSRRR